MSIPVL